MRFTFILLFFSYCSTQCIAQNGSPDYSKVDALILGLVSKTNIPGISITVNSGGNIVYSKGFGQADVKNQIAMLPTTEIRTASVSKVITATALGRLASQGKIDFDTPVGKYISYLQKPYSDLTIRQLSGHTAGVSHRPSKTSATRKQYTCAKELVSLAERTPLVFDPNTKYQYSTLAYNVLAGVIEEVSGIPYERYMMDSIFTPLHMMQTFPENIKDPSTQQAKMYYFKKGKIKCDRKPQSGSYKLPGAGFISTSRDLSNMMNAYSNGFISSAVAEEMFSSNVLENNTKTFVGIGWRLNKDVNGFSTVEHAGSRQGARTVIVHYPKKDLTIAIMVNAKCTLFIEETAQSLAQLFLAEPTDLVLKEAIETDLDVSLNSSSGAKKLNGHLNMSTKNDGELVINTEIKFLQNNRVHSLARANQYVVTTEFGFLLLKLDTLTVNGDLFLYQRLKDINRFNEEPLLQFKTKQ